MTTIAQDRIERATAIAYAYACGQPARQTKVELKVLGFEADLRSGWICNILSAFDTVTGQYIELHT